MTTTSQRRESTKGDREERTPVGPSRGTIKNEDRKLKRYKGASNHQTASRELIYLKTTGGTNRAHKKPQNRLNSTGKSTANTPKIN